MDDIAERYVKKINEVLDESAKSYFMDTKTDCIAYAIVYALCWVAEELHEVNKRCNDG